MRINIRLQMIPAMIVLLLAGGAAAVAQTRVSSSVVASGGTLASGGGFRISGTVGQAVIGRTQGVGTVALQGFWYTLPLTVSSVEEPVSGAAADRVALLLGGPNPFSDGTDLRLLLPSASNVTLKLYDGLGREVRTLVDGHRGAGMIVVHVEGGDLLSGQYTAQLVAGSVRRSLMLTVVR
jgi:hypothetical protein